MNNSTKNTFVCPWWLAYTFDNPLRRLIHPSDKILGHYVHPGMTALDIGCGFGHFSIGMALMVGKKGKVVAADMQQKMLDKTMSRATKKGVEQRIIPHLCSEDKLKLRTEVDFVLACNVLHEIPNISLVLEEISESLRAGGLMYIMEPIVHVRRTKFEKELQEAKKLGFVQIESFKVKMEHCSVLQSPKR